MVRRAPKEGSSIELGKLIVGERIGAGGFGVVHKAKLEGISVPFAVKFLDPHPANDDTRTAAKRFLREADLLFRFRHPRITPIYGVGEYDERPYILMEYFNGHSLASARDKFGTPDPEQVLPFIEMVGGALGYAHQLNVVHRDIKPTNLMTVRGDARVLDFGLAGILDPNGERFTRTADAVAGDAFCAPELFDTPKLLDPRCDIYSLGATWYWLLTGLAPRGRNLEANFRASAKVAPNYEQVLFRCLDHVDKRYQTAEDLVADVQKIRQGEPASPSSHDLSDDEARVLGVVVSQAPSSRDWASFYKIEQEIAARQSRLRTSIALRSLQARGLIDETHETEFGAEFSVYQASKNGFTWAHANLARVEVLLQEPPQQRPTASDDDDIPF